MMNTENANLLSPSVLAFVGDAVYGLCVRTALAEVNRPSGELHRLSVEMVNAAAQAKEDGISIPLPRPKAQQRAIITPLRDLNVFSAGFIFRGIMKESKTCSEKSLMNI